MKMTSGFLWAEKIRLVQSESSQDVCYFLKNHKKLLVSAVPFPFRVKLLVHNFIIYAKQVLKLIYHEPRTKEVNV